MKALVFNKKTTDWETSRGFELADVPEPTLNESVRHSDAESVLIKVYYAGVCGSDKGIWYRQSFGEQILGSLEREEKEYRIIGHEFFGQILQTGSLVAELYQLSAGDVVSCESHMVCRSCYQCRNNQANVCTNEKIIGISHDGCFAEIIKVPGHIVWKTDTTKIRPEVAATQEPFGNAVHACSKVDLAGKSVAIFGLGPIGLFSVLVARGLGASSIIGVEPNPISQEMARKLGIDYVIPLKSSATPSHEANEEAVSEIMNITGGLGVDVSFEMAGFNSSVNNALQSTRRGGDVILFGIKQGDFTIQHYDRLIVRGLTLHSVIGRELYRTWQTTRSLLEHRENKIQEQIFNCILAQGHDTILPIKDFTKELFLEKMLKHPKILIQF